MIDTTTTPPSVVATVAVGANPAGSPVAGRKTCLCRESWFQHCLGDRHHHVSPVRHRHDRSGNSPSAIAVTPDGKRVYVANQFGNNVSVITTTTTPPSVIATLAVGNFPNGVAVGPAGNRVYVANTASGNVSVIDNTMTPPSVISSIGLETWVPLALPSRRMENAFMSQNSGASTVSVIDTTTTPPSVVATVAVGMIPVAVTISPDGTLAYVTNSSSNTRFGDRHDDGPTVPAFIHPGGART